uniref:ribonuclease H n=1 Tax=Sander lucioperca TaxID=283035 RepID=A0A8C9Z4M2_SANLU
MRSSIDYGCVVYGVAAKTILEKINRLQYRALRVCIGAIKSTPINAILIEAGETPLELRREKLALAYWISLKGSGKENPTKESIQDCWEYCKFQGLGFGWTREEKVREYGMEALDFTMINPVKWRMEEVGVRTSIYLRHSYYNYLKIYTDGSKNKQECVGVGIYIPEFKVKLSKRLSDQLSVYTAEMVAAIIALQWVEEVRPDRVVLCTDSLAVIKSIQSMTSVREDLLMELHHSLLRLHRGGIDVQFCWVPAHKGVKGNEGADKLAKEALLKLHPQKT